MSQDQGSPNPLKGLLDRLRDAAGKGGRGGGSAKPRKTEMRTEAEQREADDEFERKKAGESD